MKNITVLILALNTSLVSANEVCWKYEIRAKDKNNNLITLCREDNAASLKVYYPNPGGKPTTCKQEGAAHDESENSIIFSFEEGNCANGNLLTSTTLTCSKYENKFLRCFDTKARNYEFSKQ